MECVHHKRNSAPAGKAGGFCNPMLISGVPGSFRKQALQESIPLNPYWNMIP
jgi:hypothetical protein